MLVQLLSKTANIDENKLVRLAETASARYKLYTIPKRTGGTRLIEHPSKEIKAIQRWITRVLISQFNVHESATAYRIGTGIRANAERHRTSNFTNRYDFSDFFPSFTQDGIVAYIAQQSASAGMQLDANDLAFVGNIVCRHGRLTIGAPSSPALTNAMMYDFDSNMNRICRERGLVFTRYADDLFISARHPGQMGDISTVISQCVDALEHVRLSINSSKTVFLSKKFRRTIAGVVVTPTHGLSIGRDRKREIRALIHQWCNGEISTDALAYLRGLFAFAIDVEPELEASLIRKYGAERIQGLRRPGIVLS